MSADEDKYPAETDRRRFVKGVVGSAALAGVGTTGAAAVNTATAPTGKGGGLTQYKAIKNTDGPAPRGMPQIPITIDDEGYIKGVWPEVSTKQSGGQTIKVAEEEIGGMTYSSRWFQYCGVQTNAGIQPDADQDNYFRYTKSSTYEWQSEQVSGGDKMHIDDFSNYETWGNGIGKAGLGKPATGTWRSQDVEPKETNPVQVLRSPIIEDQAQNSEWLNASTEKGVIAWLNKCTHFCCVPGFKALAGSANFGAANEVYCQCHQSVYDPFDVVTKAFTALPRPE